MRFDSSDSLGINARPRDGFTIPRVGAGVIAHRTYRLPCCSLVPVSESGDVVPAGCTGTVIEIRFPGVPCGGYVGVGVAWRDADVRKRYPAGVILRWDDASDPDLFTFLMETF